MPRVTTFLKRHTLAAGFVAVLTPLLVLLGMQFVWLQRLERVTALAHRATLSRGRSVPIAGDTSLKLVACSSMCWPM